MERFRKDNSQGPGKLIIDRLYVVIFKTFRLSIMPLVLLTAPRFSSTSIIRLTPLPKWCVSQNLCTSKSRQKSMNIVDLDFPFHRWAIRSKHNILTFMEKPKLQLLRWNSRHQGCGVFSKTSISIGVTI